jgi:chemotaxis protein MotB
MHEQHLPAHVRLAHLRPSSPKRKGPVSNAWMITFTDLVALMLTFFVLLFSMSQVQQQKWQSIVESLASNLSTVQNIETTKIAADYQVEAEIVPQGAYLEYLEPILREHLASDPLLANAVVELAADGVSISFPEARLFAGQTKELSARGEKVVNALAGVLQYLDNAIDVNTRISADDRIGEQDWELALARSVAVVRILAQSGFTGPIVARGGGGAPGDIFAVRRGGSDGLDLLVRETQRSVP